MADSSTPLGRLGESTPLVPPLYQSSVYTLADLDAVDRVMTGEVAGFIYARDGHPNAQHLAEQIRLLEGASWSLATGSGMAAVTALFLTILKQGDRVVASANLYGGTSQLLNQELARFGVETVYVDLADPAAVRAALAKPARVLYVETVSNPLLRLADLETLAGLAHDRDCRLVVDNTFATPILTRPLALGADLVMESLTKMIGGHSDVLLGTVSGQDADLLARMADVIRIWGLAPSAFECWLAGRGLATLPLRMKAASSNALALADWLAAQPAVARVAYPGRPDHPDHELARRLLQGGFGNMLAFEMKGGRDGVNRFMRAAPGIPFSPSLGHTSTTCSHPASTSHRFASPAERKRQGITDGLVRLSVGVEDVEAIQREMARGLS
jgi:cystathionine gamma-synthase